MKLFTRLITASVLLLSISNALPAHAQMTQAQFDGVKQTLGLMTLALAVDKKCALLDSVSAEAARIKLIEMKSIIRQAGVPGLDTYTKKLEDFANNNACLPQMALNKNVKAAKLEAEAIAGFYLLPWHQLYETYGSNPTGLQCDNGPNHKMLEEAVDGQKHLIDKLKKRPDYKAILPAADKIAVELNKLCNNSGQYFSNYDHANIKIIKMAIDAMLTAEAGPNVGFVKVKNFAPKIIAYRGSFIPKGQVYTHFPWAVFVGGREDVKGGNLSYMTDKSTVQIGFLRNKIFAGNIRPPSLAKFKADVFKEITVKAVGTGKTWHLNTQTTSYKIDDKKAETARQYVLSAPQSKEIMEAISAGNDLHISVQRTDRGTVNVTTATNADLQRAITYAFAPKIP